MIVPIRAALPLDAVVTVRLALTRCEVATKHEAPHSALRTPLAGIVLVRGRHGHDAICDVVGRCRCVISRVRVSKS